MSTLAPEQPDGEMETMINEAIDEIMAEREVVLPALPFEVIGIILDYIAYRGPNSALNAAMIHPCLLPRKLPVWKKNIGSVSIKNPEMASRFSQLVESSRAFTNVCTLVLGPDPKSILAAFTDDSLKGVRCLSSNSVLLLASSRDKPKNVTLADIKELTLLDGRVHGESIYSSMGGLRELSLLNAASGSIRNMLDYVPNLHSIYFFSNQDQPAKGNRFRANIIDATIRIPSWLERGLYPIRHSMQKLYFVNIVPNDESTEDDYALEQTNEMQIVNKWNAWKMMAYHYTFNCPSSMSVYQRLEKAKSIIKELEDENQAEQAV